MNDTDDLSFFRNETLDDQRTLEELEDAISPSVRSLVERYIHNCNEQLFALLLMSPFRDNAGKPLSNAFYIHEAAELSSFMNRGHDFLNVGCSDEQFRKRREAIYDKDRDPHLRAARLHCRYFQLKASQDGKRIELGTVIKYDPLTSTQDKDDLMKLDPSLRVVLNEQEIADQFFLDLSVEEADIYKQAFTLGNMDHYMQRVWSHIRNE